MIRLRVVLLFTLILTSIHGSAQGCSMCKTGAEAASAEQQKSLNRGILMLALPSVAIFAGLSWLAFRYRPSGFRAQTEEEEPQD